MTLPAPARTRRVATATAVLAVALTLAACGADDAADDVAASTGNQPAADPSLPAADAELRGVTTILRDAEMHPVAESSETGVHAPGLALAVTATGKVATLSAEVYEDLTGDRLQPDEDGEVPAEVRPADGHVFLVAEFETSDPQWEPRGNEPRTEGLLRVDGDSGTEVIDTRDDSRTTGTVVLSLPADADPDHAIIELETAGAFQSVSLVDGTRVATDVPHAYPGPAEVTIESAERLDDSFEHWISDHATVQGEVVGAFATPFLDEGYGRGGGWAAPDQQYLAVAVDWHVSESTTYDETVIRAQTADGDVFQPINDPKGLTDVFERDAVFQVPTDLDAVTIIIESAYRNGVGSGARLIEFEPIQAEISIG
ncbi:hypothetical protein V2J52_03780 [Georgenia sp. MJ173]|uniref:hypothetical protein n=1 Tax=Georgenia sunbinii TaxID=3117728 RepID=UPI002F260D64